MRKKKKKTPFKFKYNKLINGSSIFSGFPHREKIYLILVIVLELLFIASLAFIIYKDLST